MDNKTQDERIREALIQERGPSEWTDTLTPPAMAQTFQFKKAPGKKMKTTLYKNNMLRELHLKPVREQANYLAQLANYRAGIISVDWTFGQDSLELGFQENYPEPRDLSPSELVTLTDVIEMCLKSRRNVVRFKWDVTRGAEFTIQRHPLDITPY